jgi:hypothetical protein
MSSLLEDFFIMYGQDFDLVFTHDTEPIDLFCQQRTLAEQKQLLLDLEKVREDVLLGKKTLSDIRSLGLESVPNGERDASVWLSRFIAHLRKRIDQPA